MLKTLLIVSLVIIALLGVGAAWAKHKGYCNGGGAAQLISQRLTHKLDLNAEQQNRLQALTEQFRELREHREQHKAAIGQQVSQLLSTAKLDRDHAIELLDRGLQPMADRKHTVIDVLADFTDSLRPEQRSRLAELINHRLTRNWGHPRWKH